MDDFWDEMKLPVSENEVLNPLSIILVKNGSKGDRLVFRYPYKLKSNSEPAGKNTVSPKTAQENRNPIRTPPQPVHPVHQTYPRRLTLSEEQVPRPSFIFRRPVSKSPEEPPRPRNPYAIKEGLDESCFPEPNKPAMNSNVLMDLSDKDLSNLLAVNTELAERKFELKVNDVRFVGHPTLMQHPSIVRPISSNFQQTSTKIFHIVFCVHARASHSIVKCFYDLSKRLGVALRHEEYRVGYLSQEMKLIISDIDEASHEHEEDEQVDLSNYFQRAFNSLLPKSSLARLLKKVYDDVCRTGFVKLRVNNWIQLSFCLPHKIHVVPFRDPLLLVEPEKIHRCLESIRPYHALLLLVDRDELSNSFSVDASSTIPRLLQVYSPMKSLQVIAADADLTLSQAVEVASHLVYWAVATLIYPLCETNVYVIAPDAPIPSQEMEEAFLNSFPGLSLTETLADFSLAMPLGERANPVLGGSYFQTQLVHLVCWLLQYRLLIQLHTYLYLQTYLDENGIHNSLSDGEELFKMELRPYEEGGEDDRTMSDSLSENDLFLGGGTDLLIGNENTSTAAAAAAIMDLKPETKEESGGDRVDGGKLEKKSEPCDEGAALKEAIGELSERARRALEIVKPELSLVELKLFGRLSKYMNGEFHFEEIMYRENVRRSQLLLVVDKFRQVLLISEREDSSIDFFKTEEW